MTLLGGLLHRDPSRRADPALLQAMAARVPGAGAPVAAHAGPAGLFVTRGGKPPKATEALLLAMDADLVNLDELRAITGREGRCDVVARLYELEGEQGMRRLRGAFAVALWDRRLHRLTLAVDHVGIKRLYYADTAEGIAFASRPSALLAWPGVTREADPTAVYHYLNFGFVPSPHSIFPGVRRLAPGHVLVAGEGHVTTTRYWDLGYAERPMRSGEGAAAAYRQVEEAVARCLRAAAPKQVGAFLSGGTDSSTVVGLMGRLSGERVNAFAIGFQEPRFDELAYAELAARHFNAALYTHIITPDEALEALPRLVEAFDEPFGNNSAIGTLFCAQVARQCGVTQLLAGDGGDEIFGGNDRYRTDRIFARYQQVPAWLRRGVLDPLAASLPASAPGVLGKARRYVRRASIPNPRRFYSYEFFFAQEGRDLLGPALLAAVEPEAPWRLLEEHFGRVRASSELNRLLYLDLKLTLGDNDLLKVTRTAEAAGVEVRFPMLDLPLVELTATWPASFKVRGLQKRVLFKRAFRSLLPAETLAKRKHGFGVPTSLWLKAHPGFAALARETLLSSRARQRGHFRPGAIEDLLARHAADSTAFYGDLLWTVLMLELWQQRHLDGTGPA